MFKFGSKYFGNIEERKTSYRAFSKHDRQARLRKRINKGSDIYCLHAHFLLFTMANTKCLLYVSLNLQFYVSLNLHFIDDSFPILQSTRFTRERSRIEDCILHVRIPFLVKLYLYID